MKGLLKKELYMIRSRWGWTLYSVLHPVLFLLLRFGEGSVAMGCGLSGGFIASLLLSGGKEDRWQFFYQCLPYSRKQIVSVKYLIGLVLQGIALAFTGIAMMCRNLVWHTTPINVLEAMGVGMMIMAVSFSLYMAFEFRYDRMEAMGRCITVTVLTLFVVLYFGAMALAVSSSFLDIEWNISPVMVLITEIVITAASYGISWRISIRNYEKREIGA